MIRLACVRTEGGTVNPMAAAAFRFTTNSWFDGWDELPLHRASIAGLARPSNRIRESELLEKDGAVEVIAIAPDQSGAHLGDGAACDKTTGRSAGARETIPM